MHLEQLSMRLILITRKLSVIDTIIIHCSDSDVPSHDDISVITQWHLARGFDTCGYHYFIKSDGEVQKGRDIDVVGAHCYGHNTNSIGICLHGKSKIPNSVQKMALEQLITNINGTLQRVLVIKGHNEFDTNKTCPNFDVRILHID